MFRRQDPSDDAACDDIIDALFDGEKDAAAMRRLMEGQEAMEVERRRPRRGEMPAFVVVNVTPLVTDEVQTCTEARGCGLYAGEISQSIMKSNSWRSRFHGYVLSLNRRDRHWELVNKEGVVIARSLPKVEGDHIDVPPPHEAVWVPAGPQYSVRVSGEIEPTHQMLKEFAKRMGALYRTYKFKDSAVAQLDRAMLMENVDRIRNFCRGRALQRLMRFKLVGGRIKTVLRATRQLQKVARTWLCMRNERLGVLFHAWVEDDRNERERLRARQRRSITANSQNKTEVARQLAVVDATTDMQRKAALVHLYRSRLKSELRAGREQDAGDAEDDTGSAAAVRSNEGAPASRVAAARKHGLMSRVLPIEGVQKLIPEARQHLARLTEMWASARCAMRLNGTSSTGAGASPPEAVQALPDTPDHWTLLLLEWQPPLPEKVKRDAAAGLSVTPTAPAPAEKFTARRTNLTPKGRTAAHRRASLSIDPHPEAGGAHATHNSDGSAADDDDDLLDSRDPFAAFSIVSEAPGMHGASPRRGTGPRSRAVSPAIGAAYKPTGESPTATPLITHSIAPPGQRRRSPSVSPRRGSRSRSPHGTPSPTASAAPRPPEAGKPSAPRSRVVTGHGSFGQPSPPPEDMWYDPPSPSLAQGAGRSAARLCAQQGRRASQTPRRRLSIQPLLEASAPRRMSTDC
eukprot:TRINITY_DN10018_c0_g1_i1.p1 TRINITY_DN10018_c0_g1~~TRINITY_DN10018_c0_g1_i1.p1  ORF type:complete len:686 (+),score=218.86 TRINITY_DN10018_c0_g1_i1:63-2120(+)